MESLAIIFTLSGLFLILVSIASRVSKKGGSDFSMRNPPAPPEKKTVIVSEVVPKESLIDLKKHQDLLKELSENNKTIYELRQRYSFLEEKYNGVVKLAYERLLMIDSLKNKINQITPKRDSKGRFISNKKKK